MKKYLFIITTLIIFLINIDFTHALSQAKFRLGERVPDMHIESVIPDDVHNGVPFILRRHDNEFVYCINPFDHLNTTEYYKGYSYNDSMFNITDEQLNQMNIIAYYGYGYENHTDLKWYGITQFLIWKTLNLDDIYFTNTGKMRIIAYEDEVKELETLVKNYKKLPSFSGNNYDYTINSNYEEIDLNEILNNYEIKDSNIEASIIDNKLKIKTEKEGNYEITFVKKSPITRDYELYGLKGSQSLLFPGKIDDIEFKVNITVDSGTVTLHKFDSEGIKREDATLKGAIYGIYRDNELINTIETDEDGIAYIDELPYGKYYIKEITPSLGYELDEKIYEFEITKDTKDYVINSYENVIKGKVTLKKLDSERIKRENATLKGAIYGIYRDNELINTIETNEEGIAYLDELPYGKYYIKEITPSLGYELDENIYRFEVTEKTKNIIIYSNENVIKGKFTLKKYYGENGEYNLEDGAIFEIYDINNNLIKTIETKDGIAKLELDYGKYYVIQVKGKIGYKYVDSFEILVDEKKEYTFDLYDEKEVLIVEVPNTSKNDYNRLIPILFIIVGIVLVRKSEQMKRV